MVIGNGYGSFVALLMALRHPGLVSRLVLAGTGAAFSDPGRAAFTGQVFASRYNELFLMSQSRPVRSVQRSEGWTPETIAEHAAPALRPSLIALDRSQDVFGWDPV